MRCKLGCNGKMCAWKRDYVPNDKEAGTKGAPYPSLEYRPKDTSATKDKNDTHFVFVSPALKQNGVPCCM